MALKVLTTEIVCGAGVHVRRAHSAIASFCLGLLWIAVAQADAVDFSRDIQPILSRNCYECHGPDAHARKAELRLDTEAGAKAQAIVPNDPDGSELIQRILSDDPESQMPPPGPNRTRLSEVDLAMLRSWVEQGAPWATHWAFKVPEVPAPPESDGREWGVNTIDAFILAKLSSEGLTPSPEADKIKLLRRVTFDLTGLPPTLEEIDAFLGDTSAQAYERVVDRLFASPRYGEKMAMHWLDAARFADTNGYQGDFIRYMYLWRDWVINEFNANKPWDQFVIEQIAGDLLPNATPMQQLATGFVRNSRSVTEGGALEEEWRIESIVDRVETVGTAFLGLSLGCARCHDHKYDPISQREFYQFFAFFNSTAEKGVYPERHGNTGPTVRFPTPEHEKRIVELDAQLATAKDALAKAKAETEIPLDDWLAQLRATPRNEEPAAMALRLRLDGTEFSPMGGATAISTETAPDLGQAYTFVREKPFTVTAWVRADAPGPLWSKMSGTEQQRGIEVRVVGEGQIEIRLVHDAPDNSIRIVSNPAIKLGVWSHVAIAYAGAGAAGGIVVYVDGEYIGWIPYEDTLKDGIGTTEALRLGADARGTSLQGAMSDVRIYDAMLSMEQVVALIENSLASAPQVAPADEARAHLNAWYEHRNSLWTLSEERGVIGAEMTRSAFLEIEVPSVLVLEELPEPRPTYRLIRGVYDAPDTSEVLAPDVPEFLNDLPQGVKADRLALAQWLVNPANPLTARVTVNRMWQNFFGAGLVSTPDNFGTQGQRPTHPELLDWLATDFVASGWDVKAFQKRLVMSATYRQDSVVSDALLARDPANVLLARAPRYRMPAELIRDNALASSGLLTPTIGGPSVMPYQPEGLWDELASVLRGLYHEAEGPDLYRRSLYTFRKRTVPHPTLATFDAPTFEICQMKRSRTNTPLQALALLNDPTYVEAARHLGVRMLAEAGPDSGERLRYGFRLATGRWPNEQEDSILGSALSGFLDTYQAAPDEAQAFVANGKSPVADGANPIELAAYMGVARIVLSLDETITRE